MRSAFGVTVVVGIAVAIQVAVVGRSSRTIHPLAISLALQISGLLVGGIWALTQQSWQQVGAVSVQWWWIPLGALGWIIVAALGYASAKLGVTTTLALVVAAQLVAGLALDQANGQLALTAKHPVGAVMLVAGVILIASRT